ncbi:Hypp2959 [Branchiostoma lanceolatum]|uniref:Hypp2959 protein n=1 Tax=Branchiostoma lanceolatum TaxID=7740 RepID=A0A8J9ZVI7_BRALA|nr:Hypp2959 [Branchiostoma lanceolatum]
MDAGSVDVINGGYERWASTAVRPYNSSCRADTPRPVLRFDPTTVPAELIPPGQLCGSTLQQQDSVLQQQGLVAERCPTADTLR